MENIDCICVFFSKYVKHRYLHKEPVFVRKHLGTQPDFKVNWRIFKICFLPVLIQGVSVGGYSPGILSLRRVCFFTKIGTFLCLGGEDGEGCAEELACSYKGAESIQKLKGCWARESYSQAYNNIFRGLKTKVSNKPKYF